jgi:Trypsin
MELKIFVLLLLVTGSSAQGNCIQPSLVLGSNLLQLLTLSDCHDLYNVPGNCRYIKLCPHIVAQNISRHADVEFLNYLDDSRRRCHNVDQDICCTLLNAAHQSDVLKTLLPTPATGCGYPSVVQSKMIAGDDAALGAWPWMALLGYANRVNQIEYGCGGSLITFRHVLTAAHCIKRNL